MIEIDSTNWRKAAACRGMDAELFNPERWTPTGAAEAKAVCAGCPDLAQEFCLLEGFMFRDPGVRGGLTTSEREQLHGVRLRYGETGDIAIRRRNATLTEADVPEGILTRTKHARPEQVEWFYRLHDDGWTVRRIALLFGFARTAVVRFIEQRENAYEHATHRMAP